HAVAPGQALARAQEQHRPAHHAPAERAGRQRGGARRARRGVHPRTPAGQGHDSLHQGRDAHAAPVPVGLSRQPAAHGPGTPRPLVGGGPQSGRTTFVRTLVTSLASRFRPDQAHVYAVEQRPSGLGAFAGLPHVGAVLSPAEPDRIRRLVTWLDAEVQRRTVSRLAAAGGADPWIVVVIDGWEHFENRSDPNFTETSLLGTLRNVVAAGPPVGVHIVAVGGQEMMNGK